MLKVGSTEFEFRQSPTRPTDASRLDHTQTIIRDRSVLLAQSRASSAWTPSATTSGPTTSSRCTSSA